MKQWYARAGFMKCPETSKFSENRKKPPPPTSQKEEYWAVNVVKQPGFP